MPLAARNEVKDDPLHGLRSAKVFGRGEWYVVTSSSRWRYGAFTSPPYFVVERSASDEELGAAVIRAIEGFTLLADEKDLSDEAALAAGDELLAVVGVKSHQTFARGHHSSTSRSDGGDGLSSRMAVSAATGPLFTRTHI